MTLIITGEGLQIVPPLLWHETYVYNGHIRESVTLTPIVERLAGEVSLLVFTTKVSHTWYSSTHPCWSNTLTHCATAAVKINRYRNLFENNLFQEYH